MGIEEPIADFACPPQAGIAECGVTKTMDDAK